MIKTALLAFVAATGLATKLQANLDAALAADVAVAAKWDIYEQCCVFGKLYDMCARFKCPDQA